MNSKKSIGILAGMGPRSTSPFLELVYDECQDQCNAKYDIDYPKIVIYSWPTPFYIDRKVDQDSLKESVVEGLTELEKTGISVIAMPCNTAHIFFDELQKSINVKLLNIVEETSKIIPANSKRVGLMATRTTIDSGVYQKILKEKNLDFVHNDDWQVDVDCMIKMMKNKEDFSEIYYNLTLLLVKMKSCHIDTLLCACTDLSILSSKVYSEIKIIDSSKALAAALIREYLRK